MTVDDDFHAIRRLCTRFDMPRSYIRAQMPIKRSSFRLVGLISAVARQVTARARAQASPLWLYHFSHATGGERCHWPPTPAISASTASAARSSPFRQGKRCDFFSPSASISGHRHFPPTRLRRAMTLEHEPAHQPSHHGQAISACRGFLLADVGWLQPSTKSTAVTGAPFRLLQWRLAMMASLHIGWAILLRRLCRIS